MKLVRSLISVTLTIALFVALNYKNGPLPPMGKFLDPVNGFWANSESGISIPEQISLPGISQPVKVVYDDLLIPHVFADHEDDLYTAIGYVHAYHRLWQMEFQTHAAAGRLSEVVGEITLDMDRGQRRKGMTFGARNFVSHLDDRTTLIFEKYSIGVNHFIEQLEYGDLPLEYKILDYEPEEWTSFKSALLYKYMSDMLNTGEKDLENTNFRSIYGKELLDLIYPDVDNYQDPVVEKTNNWEFEAIVKSEVKSDLNEIVALNPVPGANPYNGSNNWAVSPSRSATGNALLCNDMHLSLYLPSLWYYNQLSGPGLNVFGHSLPGIPLVITGFNDSIAWGLTNAQRDLVDWYKIEFKDESKNAYLLDGKYVPTTKTVEEIKIRNSESFYDTIVYTIYGPVMYDDTYRSESQKNGYARRWVDHDPSNAFQMFYHINRAKNIDDYMSALDYFSSPAQNVIFASASGDIAHRVQGKYPLNDYEEGKFIKDGTKSANNWTAFIPNEHNAFWKNPARGFVSSANQHPVDSTYPYYVTARSFEAYRNRRINDILRGDSSVTIEDLKKLHFDNYNLKAAESLPLILELLDGVDLSVEEMDIVEKLNGWKYRHEAETVEPVYYEIWQNRLFAKIWDEIKLSRDEDVWLKYPTWHSTISLMKRYPDHDFFDIQGTDQRENIRDLALLAFREMITEISAMEQMERNSSWGKYKSTYIGHQLRIEQLGRHNLMAGGNSGTVVNATGRNHGPSQRIIIEMDPGGVKAWGHYPGGQSGNPGSHYYDNMVDPWVNGHYFDLLFMHSPDEQNDRIIFSQTLTTQK